MDNVSLEVNAFFLYPYDYALNETLDTDCVFAQTETPQDYFCYLSVKDCILVCTCYYLDAFGNAQHVTDSRSPSRPLTTTSTGGL